MRAPRVAEDVLKAIVLHDPVGRREADGEAVAMAEEVAGIVVAQVDAEVVAELIDDKEDRVIQIFVRPKGAERKAVIASLPGGAIRDAEELEIALPVARHVVEARHRLKVRRNSGTREAWRGSVSSCCLVSSPGSSESVCT